eukprot:GHRR01005617.1.p2 GENE.GHRR01005617.1~~GHRR01005617.1.p2  ORF type:complete len:262 (+),score=88.75 GHRR01005617.1:1184-1969(+)
MRHFLHITLSGHFILLLCVAPPLMWCLLYMDRSLCSIITCMVHITACCYYCFVAPDAKCLYYICQVRKLVCEMILATDMDVHFALLKRFEDAVAAQPDVRQWRSLEQRSLIFQMLVHLADLANPSRPWHLALKWAEWVVTEFLEQGVKEAEAGIPVSDMCNKDKVCMPAAQLFFIERFMQPTLDAFKPAAPSFHSMATPWLEDTKARWGIFKEAGVRMPHHGYPQLAPPAAGQQQKPWAVLGAGHGSSSGASAQLSNEQQQ